MQHMSEHKKYKNMGYKLSKLRLKYIDQQICRSLLTAK